MNSVTHDKHPFSTFDEAVKIACAEPGTELVGMKFIKPYTRLGIFIINVSPDEPYYINVFYEGGALFSSMGEEELYDAEDAPAEAKDLYYARETDLGGGGPTLMGSTSEYAFQETLPELGGDAKYRDHAHFTQAAGAAFQTYWRQK